MTAGIAVVTIVESTRIMKNPMSRAQRAALAELSLTSTVDGGAVGCAADMGFLSDTTVGDCPSFHVKVA
ncbi:hypothetical protein GCM10009595_18030 [Falsarthrobacter nasiphocae]